MKMMFLALAAAVGLAGVTVAPDADAGGRHHRHHRHHGHHWHSGPRWSVDLHVGRPWYGAYPYGYYGYYSGWYGPRWVAPVVVAPVVGAGVVAETRVIESPPVYIERNDVAPSAAPAENWWYWCAEAGKYYPYVESCAGGWQRVPPQPAR